MEKINKTESDKEIKKMSTVMFETFVETMRRAAASDTIMEKILEDIEIRRAIAPFLKDIENIIATNPTFRNMPLSEVVETEEFEKLFKEIYEIKYEATMDSKAKEVISVLTLNPAKVINYLIPNTKVANQLTTGNLYGRGAEVIVSGKSPKTKEVTTKVILNFEDEGLTLSGRYEINAYDRIVHNALVSIKLAGNKTFTPAMVYRTINGLTNSEFVRPEAVEKVTQSIDKLAATRAKIDFTDEAKMYRKDVK
ncbi:MAG: hypothetical protein LBI03_00880, partial [Clostridiales bacterium]|nr:hypothetical protein [Clostridiales bacterium]